MKKEIYNVLGFKGIIARGARGYYLDFDSKRIEHCEAVDEITYYLTRNLDVTLHMLARWLGYDVNLGTVFPEFKCKEDLIKFIKYLQKPIILFR